MYSGHFYILELANDKTLCNLMHAVSELTNADAVIYSTKGLKSKQIKAI